MLSRIPANSIVALRPSAIIHISNRVETIIVGRDQTYAFIGETYHSIIQLLLKPIAVGDLLATLPSLRERALAKAALNQLFQKQLLAACPPAFQDLIYERDLLGIAGEVQPLIAVSSDDDGLALALQNRLRKLGMRVSKAKPCDGARSVKIIGTVDAITDLQHHIDGPTLIIFPAPDRIVVGPQLDRHGGIAQATVQQIGRIFGDLSQDGIAITMPRQMRDLALSWAAQEISRWLIGSCRYDSTYRSICFSSGDVENHHLVDIRVEGPTDLSLDYEQTDQDTLNNMRHSSIDAALDRLLPVVDRCGGVIPFIQNITRVPLPVYVSLHDDGNHSAARLGMNHGRTASSGKGFSDAAAKVSCIAEAIERFSCGYHADAEVKVATLSEIGTRGVDPRQWLNFSEQQYCQRGDSQDFDGFNWVPPPYREHDPIGWVQGVNLGTNEPVHLPAALTYFGYNRDGEHNYGLADSSGCAAGATLAEALLHAILELIERDACGIWWYNMLRRPSLPIENCNDDAVLEVVKWLQDHGRRVDFLDLTADFGVPVCCSVSIDERGRDIHIGLGASLTMLEAARRALSEMLQVGIIKLDAMPDVPLDPVQREIVEWYRNAKIEDHPYLVAEGVKACEWTSVQRRDARVELKGLVRKLNDAGLSVFAINMSRHGLPLKVVRVVVPGLRHFWRRLGPGRLYDVPESMGWVPARRSEGEMNPVSFFM